MKGWRVKVRSRLGTIMKCFCSAEQLNADDTVPSSESLATRDYSASMYSSRTTEGDRRRDTGNIEEAESSLREGVCLNYEVDPSPCFICKCLCSSFLQLENYLWRIISFYHIDQLRILMN